MKRCVFKQCLLKHIMFTQACHIWAQYLLIVSAGKLHNVYCHCVLPTSSVARSYIVQYSGRKLLASAS